MQPTENEYKLAKIFLNYSLEMKAKENLLITTSGSGAFGLVKAVYVEALKMGVYPQLDLDLDFLIGRSQMGGFSYQFYDLANEWQLKSYPKQIMEAKVDWADAYVRIVAQDNLREFNQIDPKKVMDRAKLTRPIFDKLIDSDRWVLTYYPTLPMAQEAGVSMDWLIEFYYKSVLVDYSKMHGKLSVLEGVLDKGKIVRVKGKDTELIFSIEGRLAKASHGKRNIPDGEVFLAPIHTSLEGKIYFDFPSMYLSREVRGIRLTFKKGKIIDASAEHGDDTLQKILEVDDGVRYIGEFSIGANFNIKRGMKNTLFDEKIGGTIHMALGKSFREKRGGGTNNSALHWDIVKDMRSKGSIVEVDGVAVLRDGKLLV